MTAFLAAPLLGEKISGRHWIGLVVGIAGISMVLWPKLTWSDYGITPVTIAVSVAAEGLVNELKMEAAEEIFTAALLHDVGKLVLGDFVQDEFKQIETAVSQGISFEMAEKIVLGTNHADIGAHILTNWALPSEIVNAVQFHHAPEGSQQNSTMLDIVHVANFMSMMIGIGIGRDGLQHQPSIEVTERLGLEPHHLEKVASQTAQWVQELSEVLGPG